jgi:CheY-like chemotaxis protein
MLRPIIGEHISLQVALGDDAGTVKGDPGEIQQVLLNLCLNARDAMPSGGTLLIKTGTAVLREPYWDPRFEIKPGRHVVFTIMDTGHGMSAEVRARIFEPFFTTKEVGKGTGLGLAMAYGIIQDHRGAIHVYSEPDKGTTFKIYLPAGDESADEQGTAESQPGPGGCETILVAEDEAMVRNLALRILENGGYKVLVASDGAEAWRAFQEHSQDISLVILDAIMPKLAGHDVYRRIKAECPQAKVVFASGYDPETNHSQFILRENLRLIEKPFDASTLLRTVREVLDEKANCQPAAQTAACSTL